MTTPVIITLALLAAALFFGWMEMYFLAGVAGFGIAVVRTWAKNESAAAMKNW